MQLTEKRKRVQPWWVILLLIPMLVSCSAPIAIVGWKVSLYLGNSLLNTVTGQVIEKVLDNLVVQLLNTVSPASVIPDPDNPLQGTNSKRMKITVNLFGEERKSFEINHPRMVRDSTSSAWHIAPDCLRKALDQITET